jgi:hypothetical protein
MEYVSTSPRLRANGVRFAFSAFVAVKMCITFAPRVSA